MMRYASSLASSFSADLTRAPIQLADIGAAEGVLAQWSTLTGFTHTLAFEPDKRSFDTLPTKPGVTYLNAALGSENTTKQLNLTRKLTCTSLFPPNKPFLALFPEAERYDVVATTEMTLRPLDEVLAEAGRPGLDFIKIDTQGAELDILKGAEHTLACAIGLEIEVEFQPIYQGQPLFGDIDALMTDKGFTLFDLRPAYWKRSTERPGIQEKGMLVFGDALYFRSPENLRAACADAAQARDKLLHAACLYALYGYLDWTLAVFTEHGDLFTPAECHAALALMQKRPRQFWQKVASRLGLDSFAKSLADRLNPAYHNAFRTGDVLGSRTSQF